MSDTSVNQVQDKTPQKLQEILDLEKSIKNYFDAIEAKRQEMTQQKDMVKDAFLNDEAYFKQEEKIKEVKQAAEKAKSKIESTPSIIAAKNEAKDLQKEIKEMQHTLSQHLLKHHELSGNKAIMIHEDEEYDIITDAKLKKKDKKSRFRK